MTGPTPLGPYLARLSRINPVDYQDAGTQAHLRALAAPLDDLAERAYRVMLARLVWFAPEDALHLLGEERGLQRFPGEPLPTYRRRVHGAWAYWAQAGTVPGLVTALEHAGYRAVVVEHFRDPDPVRWAEFSVVVGPLERLRPDAYWDGAAPWDGSRSWGFDLPAVPLASLVDLIRDLKPAHARLRQLIWSPRGRYWGGGVSWAEDREGLPRPIGWGVQTGYEGYLAPERTDSGPAWGESDIEIIYDLEGAPDA